VKKKSTGWKEKFSKMRANKDNVACFGLAHHFGLRLSTRRAKKNLYEKGNFFLPLSEIPILLLNKKFGMRFSKFAWFKFDKILENMFRSSYSSKKKSENAFRNRNFEEKKSPEEKETF
jgi:hypothetical protein